MPENGLSIYPEIMPWVLLGWFDHPNNTHIYQISDSSKIK